MTALAQASGRDDRTLSRKFKFFKGIPIQFRKKWSVDYLAALQQRPKWHENKPQYVVNDIALIIEDNTEPFFRPLKKITKLFDRNDYTERLLQVRTQTGLQIPQFSPFVLLEKDGKENHIQESKITDNSMDEG